MTSPTDFVRAAALFLPEPFTAKDVWGVLSSHGLSPEGAHTLLSNLAADGELKRERGRGPLKSKYYPIQYRRTQKFRNPGIELGALRAGVELVQELAWRWGEQRWKRGAATAPAAE